MARVWLWDQQERQYLGALAGISVSCLGHGHPRLMAAIAKQAARPIHTLNSYGLPRQTGLASRARQAGLLTNVTRERVIHRPPPLIQAFLHETL